MIKLTSEFVGNVLKNMGCELLTPYVNTRTPIEYMCSCGAIRKIKFRKNNFTNNRIDCPNCKKKLNYDDVKNIFESEGCKLLSNTYVDSHHKLPYECSCGTISEILLHNFKRGMRCRKCGTKKSSKKFRYGYEYVKSYFEEQSCCLL